MIPTWVGVLATLASTMVAFTGVLIGARITRKADEELDTWRHREETMRMVRWAVEQITTGGESKTHAGVVTLRSLMRSELLQPEDYDLVAALTAAVAIDRVGEATYADLADANTVVVEGDNADG